MLGILRDSARSFDWLSLLNTNGEIKNGHSEPGKQGKRRRQERAQDRALDATPEKGKCLQGKPSHQLKAEEVPWRKKDGALVPQTAAPWP